MTKYIKLAVLTIIMAIGSSIQAQQVTGDATETDGTTKIGKKEDLSKSSVLNGTIRVIDNKGTKKFLQVKNGLTLLTDVSTDGGIISTWQLGGTLTDNTYIDASGKVFALDGIKLLSPTLTAGAATTASIATTAADGTSHGGAGTGWTVLIRDEATGAVQKIQLSDLFEVTAIRREATPATNTTPGVQNIVIAGLPVINAANEAKLFVFRNGVKLRWTTDFTGATAGSIDINISADLPLYAGDVIEIHYIN